MAEMITVTFVPQAWINDYACNVDPEGPTTWQVSCERLKGIWPDTYESDDLRFQGGAPQWVQDWSGPFYITWDTTAVPEA